MVVATVSGCTALTTIPLTDATPPGVEIEISGLPGGTIPLGPTDPDRAISTAGNSGIIIDALASDGESGLFNLSLAGEISFSCKESFRATPRPGRHPATNAVVQTIRHVEAINLTEAARAANGGLPTTRFVRLDLAEHGCAPGSPPEGGMSVVLAATAENGAHRASTTGRMILTTDVSRRTK